MDVMSLWCGWDAVFWFATTLTIICDAFEWMWWVCGVVETQCFDLRPRWPSFVMRLNRCDEFVVWLRRRVLICDHADHHLWGIWINVMICGLDMMSFTLVVTHIFIHIHNDTTIRPQWDHNILRGSPSLENTHVDRPRHPAAEGEDPVRYHIITVKSYIHTYIAFLFFLIKKQNREI